LADAAADRQRNLVVHDRPVVRELEEVELVRQLQLAPSSFSPCIGRPSAETVPVDQSS
jgi:hypothetical protein